MFIVVLLILCLLVWLWLNSQPPRKYPPGPKWWPILGNIPTIAFGLSKLKCHHLVWDQLSEKYGEIVGLKLGSSRVVIVSGKERIREVLSRDEFDGRPDGYFFRMRSFGKKMGLVFGDGPMWSEQRRMMLKHMKTFGYGGKYMENKTLDEAEALLSSLQHCENRPIEMNPIFDISIINVLWSIVAGERFQLNDTRLQQFCDMIKGSFRVVDMSGGILNQVPILRFIAPNLTGYTELTHVISTLQKFIVVKICKNTCSSRHRGGGTTNWYSTRNETQRGSFLRLLRNSKVDGDYNVTIEEHKKTLNPHAPRDVIDAFLAEMLVNNESSLDDEILQVICLDILQAGSETTSNTLLFLFIYMIRNPNVQNKVHEELDTVIGRERVPSLGDRQNLPYVEAAIMEVLRISTVAPFGIAHCATKTAELGDYIIEKGTIVLLSIYSMHMDKYWKDPHNFRPERFLSSEGKVVQDQWLMAFGCGKRRCLGEVLAKSNIFIFFTMVMQRYTLLNPPNTPLPSTEGLNGVTLAPRPFQVLLQRRI